MSVEADVVLAAVYDPIHSASLSSFLRLRIPAEHENCLTAVDPPYKAANLTSAEPASSDQQREHDNDQTIISIA